MSRPRTIDRETILSAARELFLTHGYGVSTATIAAAAGCSEGTLFKRFQTKEGLFSAAIGLPDFRVDERVEGLAGTGDPKENLEHLCLELIEFLREIVPRTLRLWGHQGLDKLPPHRGPHRAIKAIAGYVDQEMALGRIGPGDPEVVARMVLGSAHHYVFLEILGEDRRMPMPARTFVRCLTDLLWRGIDPKSTRRDAGEEQ